MSTKDALMCVCLCVKIRRIYACESVFMLVTPYVHVDPRAGELDNVQYDVDLSLASGVCSL